MSGFRGRGLTKVSNPDKSEAWHGFLDLKKVDAEQRIVEGFASTEELDGQPGMWLGQLYKGDVVTSNAIAEALPDYMEWANLREMHELNAVGTVLKAELIAGDVEVDGRTYHNPLHVIAKIVDDEAWKKVKEGVYKGFSIGGKVIKAVLDKLGGETVRKVIKLLLQEISLVDRPANPGARILLWKSFSLDEQTQRIRDAWRNQFHSDVPMPKSTDAWVTEVLSDRVIVQTEDGLYAYPFSMDESGEIAFETAPTKVRREYVADTGAEIAAIQKKDYPWAQCIRDQTERYGSEDTAKKVCGMIRAKYGGKASGAGSLNDAESNIVYDGELDFFLGEIETELGIAPKTIDPKGGTKVTKLQDVKVQKAAADPSKAVSMLQALRDEAELAGDLEGASLFSQSIALALQAAGDAGQAEEPEGGTPSPDGEATAQAAAGEEDLQMAASKGDLKKAGRTFSGPNATAMHGVIQALAKMLAGSGDETAAKVVSCYAAPAESEAEAAKAAATGDLQKVLEPQLEALQKSLAPQLEGLQKSLADVTARMDVIEHMPAPGGPVLRTVEKVIAGQTPPAGATTDADLPSIADMRKQAALETDPLKKAELTRQLWIAERGTVKN